MGKNLRTRCGRRPALVTAAENWAAGRAPIRIKSLVPKRISATDFRAETRSFRGARRVVLHSPAQYGPGIGSWKNHGFGGSKMERRPVPAECSACRTRFGVRTQGCRDFRPARRARRRADAGDAAAHQLGPGI